MNMTGRAGRHQHRHLLSRGGGSNGIGFAIPAESWFKAVVAAAEAG
jgi:S1-C subfamily serine protease